MQRDIDVSLKWLHIAPFVSRDREFATRIQIGSKMLLVLFNGIFVEAEYARLDSIDMPGHSVLVQ